MWSDSTSPPALTATPRVGPYELREVLGHGAMSVVYRATREGRAYAVKLLSVTASVDPVSARVHFRREAAAIARLSHPSLVRVIEVGESEGRAYLVMELAEGETLDARLARAPLDAAQTVALAVAIGGALAEVHRFGLVHRDIKPENIVVDAAGVARLIDFGLVAEANDSDAIVGSAWYSAPEQVGVLKRPVGAPADLYSLGATLFECLAGAPPLGRGSDADLLHRIATEPAPDLGELCPGCRPALAAIIARLLCKDPDDRYQSARGLLADLERLDALDDSIRATGAAPLGARDVPVTVESETTLFGRGAPMSRIEQAIEQAQLGVAGFIQVEGEGGIGKTRLVREAARRAADQGALVLSGRCHEFETAPFGPLREAVDQHAARIARLAPAEREAAVAHVRQAAGDWAPLVRGLSQGLARILGSGGEIRTLEPDAERQRYYGALASFFLNLGSPASPLVLTLDDVQWLDEGSLRVLGRIAACAETTHFVVLSTVRDGAAEAGAGYLDAVGRERIERLALKPLARGEVEALITARLGGPLAANMVDKIVALTSGNPFALEEHLRALIESGVIRPTARGWVSDLAALDAVRLPSDVVELVMRRLSALGAQTAQLVGAAAVIGARFSLGLLERAAGVGAAQAAHGVEQMVAAGLVERRGDGEYAFLYERVREAAIERMPEATRRDCHQVIAEALDAGDPGTVDLYALARHYTGGHPERDPRRVAEVCLQAGQRALAEHAYEGAFELLERALEMATRAETYEVMALPLREGLGRACALTGRLDRAFEHLREGLKHARDRHDRFRIKHLLTLTFASQGRNDDALDTLLKAFSVLGRPLPRSGVGQLVVVAFLWVAALAMRLTGLGYGRAQGEERERRRVLSQHHYAGSMIALFQGRPALMIQFIVRDFYNVHFLGATPETAIALSVYGAVLGTFLLRSVMERFTRAGVEMAAALDDRAALAVCRAYQSMGTKWSGDLERGNRLLLDALPDLNHHVPGSWYAAMMICEQAYSYLHAGRATAAIEHVRSQAAWLERTNNLMFRYNTRSVLYAEMMVCGEVEGANALWNALEAEYAPIAGTIYVRLARCIATLEVMVDREETGPAIDEAITSFQTLVSEDYYSNAARMLTGYARLVQFQHAKPSERSQARKRLEEATRALGLRALVPVFRCHVYIWRAALARADRQYARASKLLTRAHQLAQECQSPRGLYHATLERARLARESGDGGHKSIAAEALEIAANERWRNKVRRLRAEFGLRESRASRGERMALNTTLTTSRSAEQARRYADALLQVSLAFTSTLDGDELAKNALNELARVLGAERALLFLSDPATGELVLKANTGAGAESISRTVMRRVTDTRTPLILTGTDEGETLGSQSIVTYGLRSIMAAPLLLRDRMIGVVYLDSRLAKGMFTEDDLTLLRGVSNHIAIAVETASMARVEAERAALQRDIELVGTVQNLLMPKARSFHTPGLRGAGFSRPASQCGGDWWWYEVEKDGSVLLLLGDVSGHGAAPAMITSSVAGAFRTLRGLERELTPVELLREFDRRVRDFGGGFHMTMTVARIDPARRELRVWNAAGPELFIVRASGAQCIAVAGSLLGDSASRLEVGEAAAPFGPGDRLLMCTDGLLELKRDNGRPLGARRVSQMFTKLRSETIDAVPARLAEEIDAALSGRPQDDDITLLVIESTRPDAPTSDDP